MTGNPVRNAKHHMGYKGPFISPHVARNLTVTSTSKTKDLSSLLCIAQWFHAVKDALFACFNLLYK
jgi:hypothetical protein